MAGSTYARSFFKQKTAYEIRLSLVGSEMCIRDRGRAVELAQEGLLQVLGKRLLPTPKAFPLLHRVVLALWEAL